MKIVHVVGARPNFMKVAPIMREMAKHHDEFDQMLVHTGQHYDDNMSKAFLRDLERPVTVEVGTNQLVPLHVDVLLTTASAALVDGLRKGSVPELWDGETAGRIACLIRS